MFGQFGNGELLVTLFVVVPVVCLPVLLIVALLRRLFGRRREVDELRARVAEVEATLESRHTAS